MKICKVCECEFKEENNHQSYCPDCDTSKTHTNIVILPEVFFITNKNGKILNFTKERNDIVDFIFNEKFKKGK